MYEVLLDKGQDASDFDEWHIPREAIDILKTAVGKEVRVGTETDAYMDFGIADTATWYRTREGTLIDVKPNEIVIAEFRGKGKKRVEVVLPAGATSFNEGKADEKRMGIEKMRNVFGIMEDNIKTISFSKGKDKFELLHFSQPKEPQP